MQGDKIINLDPDTKKRLAILASLNGVTLKPFIEMSLKKLSLEANNLINEKWLPKNQSKITEKTFKK